MAKADPKRNAAPSGLNPTGPTFVVCSCEGTMPSEGVVLILGRDGAAIEAAALLAPHLDVTVMLADARAVTPPRATAFPVVQGRVRQASGHLGAFVLTIDGYAMPAASSRGALQL